MLACVTVCVDIFESSQRSFDGLRVGYKYKAYKIIGKPGMSYLSDIE